MTTHVLRRFDVLVFAPLTALAVAFGSAGCEAETVHYPVYVVPPPPGPPPVACDSGVDEGDIETNALLELDPGYGVGVTAEYASDGTWRFAASCDWSVYGIPCDWSVLVAPIDGTIDGYDPEGVEDDDIIERYPTRPGVKEEDGVLLVATTHEDLDAFVVFATPDAGLTVSVEIDGNCAGPYLYWVEDGAVRTSSTYYTDLYPRR
jgi:hypothetical protein